ncbi:hypothetical protein Dtox_2197 [Desulfofarcimen acetoxidans DSM 771]|uniref:Uncharacterized protein n=1 Tax=Desulfofarcimen acetoxidans (strain ATCC 49208 / DSM 771 / KCTC 5769 / VKM B-1644 / 5575) TaxID=485916 RepID=C8VZN8_DESAS|nr:hypothetical protein [Desulfofarcimen acetoxidans]ACV63016.1 hypothetical protein Dtox_2197 [Desulfofarcimen acetoxidans DSM 771]
MDFAAIIQDKIKKINAYEKIKGISSVMTHIERALMYFENGVKKLDDEYFNDVIYRTNQAYEGILKEAYKVFTQRNLNAITPYRIEEYFSENQVFNERVKNLFSEYRKNWRNSSTHDYSLSFTEEEAVLAINTVMSFIYLLINQISEKIAYNKQMSNMAAAFEQVMGRVNRLKKEFDEYVIDLLLDFTIDMKTGDLSSVINEYEIAGKLNAFLNYTASEIYIYRDITVGEKERYRPDFILEQDGKKIILELKRGLALGGEQAAMEQLQVYLEAARLDTGILFVPGTVIKEYDVKTEKINKDDMFYKLIKITPRGSQ